MLRQCDRPTVEALSMQFLELIRDFQLAHTGMNLELLNAIAIAGALVLASGDEKQAEQLRNFFLVALDDQVAGFRREFGGEHGRGEAPPRSRS